VKKSYSKRGGYFIRRVAELLRVSYKVNSLAESFKNILVVEPEEV